MIVNNMEDIDIPRPGATGNLYQYLSNLQLSYILYFLYVCFIYIFILSVKGEEQEALEPNNVHFARSRPSDKQRYIFFRIVLEPYDRNITTIYKTKHNSTHHIFILRWQRKRKITDSVLWRKPLHRKKIQKATWQHTSNTQRLWTDLGRSVGVTIVTCVQM